MSRELKIVTELLKAIEDKKVTVIKSYRIKLGRVDGFLIENEEHGIEVFVYKSREEIYIEPHDEAPFSKKDVIQYIDLYEACEKASQETDILCKLKKLNKDQF